MSIKLNFEIQRQDYVDFNKHHFIKTKLKKTIITGALVLVVMHIVFSLDGYNLEAGIVASLVGILIYTLLILRSINSTKRIPKDDGAILGTKVLEFTEDGITHTDANSNGFSKWSAIKYLQQGSKAFYLYMDTNLAILIPKRCFKDMTEMDDFETFVTERLNNA
jgi:FtsH-binding integral membrane protein